MTIAEGLALRESSVVINLCNYVTPKLLRTNGQSCNCTLFNDDGKHYLLSRVPSYTLCDKYYSYWPDNKLNTINRIYRTDEEFNLEYIKDLNNPYFNPAYKFNGLEDFRIINWNNTNYFTCTRLCGNSYKAPVCFGTIDNLRISSIRPIRTNNRVERNWMMIETEPFNCVYSTKPYKKLNFNTGEFTDLSDEFDIMYSGSSPLVIYNDEKLISLVHTRNEQRQYKHKLVLYDYNLKPIKISQPFTFLGCTVEFCTCLKVNSDGITLLPSVYDGITYVVDIPNTLLNSLFDHSLTDSTIDCNLNNKLYEDAKSIGADEVATTIACTVTNVDYIKEALYYNKYKSTGVNSKRMRSALLKIRCIQVK